MADQGAKVREMVSEAPSLEAAVDRAYLLLQEIREGAKAALMDPELAAILDARYPIPPKHALLATLSKESNTGGNVLFEKALEKMTQVFKTRYPEMAGGCFIAGTLVHTDKGLVPIEQIKVGDMVLSKPEQGGECCYKKVLKTFVHEDMPICAVKYMLIGGDVNYGHPDYMPNDLTIHHCYATPSHPFFVRGIGWTSAEELRPGNILELSNGALGEVLFSWPVIRSVEPGFGRVCSNMYAEGQEVHIVDFRLGSNMWKYTRWKPESAPVPYHCGFTDDELIPVAKIHESDEPELRTRVYNLEVDEFHTYYVGELGVWVHNNNCAGLVLVTPKYGSKVPAKTWLFDSESEINEFIRQNPDFRGQAMLRASSEAQLQKGIMGDGE